MTLTEKIESHFFAWHSGSRWCKRVNQVWLQHTNTQPDFTIEATLIQSIWLVALNADYDLELNTHAVNLTGGTKRRLWPGTKHQFSQFDLAPSTNLVSLSWWHKTFSLMDQFAHGSGVPPRKLVPLWAVAATADSVQDGSLRIRPKEEEVGV